MKAFFSKRHEEALFESKLKPSFSSNCRGSIRRLLEKYSELSLYGENITFLHAKRVLEEYYGKELEAFNEDNAYVPANLAQVIESGYPAHVLDAIEAWFYLNPDSARECEIELNEALGIHRSPWRIINGEAILVDSEYLHQEVRAKTIHLLRECDIPGAIEEYQDALNDLTSGETKDAVVNAHKSVESVMKAVLETDADYTFGKLLEMLIKSGIIPEYYNEFLTHFEKLALGVVKERNRPARGHGQGKKPTIVSPSLAEFAVNLAGAINIFIIKHWIEIKREQETEIEDLPF